MTGQTFITGGSGFIGRHLALALRARGVAVRVLVRPARDAAARQARHALVSAGVELVEGCVTDPDDVRAALGEADTVFHLAGQLLVPGVPDEQYERLHVGGTRAVLAACAARGAVRRVVHCSTTGVLGPTGPAPAGEEAPQRPSTIYERTKAAGEALALESARREGLPLVVARPALVYGPGDLHLLGWFRAIKAGLYRVVGRGENLLHPVFIADLVDGLVRCALAPVPGPRAYNLVGERPLPIRELAAAIAAALGVRLPATRLPLWLARAAAVALETIPGVPPARLPLTRSRIAFMTESRAYSGERARDELGFVPQVALSDGLARTVAWYRQEGLL
ncbi:MAG TPA: NAD-dependent epimerase/dehydratase family protein [Chloroflexaceae bacterium]|nr:NAD-dependent epimerase/dehydratase family protein [Chloroflexaceae bacterium]